MPYYLYEFQKIDGQNKPVYTGLSHPEQMGLRDHILSKYSVDIQQHWVVQDSFACGHFVLTTDEPAKMWS